MQETWVQSLGREDPLVKLQYFGHLVRRVDSLEKTLMLGGIGGRRRRGQQRMRWLDGTEIDSHKLLVRAGLVKKLAGGLYTFLPLGLRPQGGQPHAWGHEYCPPCRPGVGCQAARRPWEAEAVHSLFCVMIIVFKDFKHFIEVVVQSLSHV